MKPTGHKHKMMRRHKPATGKTCQNQCRRVGHSRDSCGINQNLRAVIWQNVKCNW